MHQKNNKLIVVLGMHRSGTSAITKSLELLGVGLGSDLHPAGSDNPRGFWENRECIEINESLLKHLGSSYDRLDLAWSQVGTDSTINELRLRAVQLISYKLKESNGLWGFKDPRTCRLLAFWNEVFQAVNCEVSLVIAVRNPASVVASLAARNDIAAEKAYFLWLQHVLPSLRFMQHARRVVVDYDELLANPYKQLTRIASKLDLPLLNQQSPLVIDFEKNFLECGLRHTRYTEAELMLDGHASSIVIDTYSLAHDLATDQIELESAEIQDLIEALDTRLEDCLPAFDYIKNLEDERLRLWQAMSERDGQITTLNEAITDRDSQISWLNQGLMNARQELEQVLASNTWQFTNQIAVESAEIQDSIEVLDTRLKDCLPFDYIKDLENERLRLWQAMSERDGQIATLSEAIADRDSQISWLNQGLGDAGRELEQVLASKTWQLTKPLRYARRMIVGRPYSQVRRTLSNVSRGIWQELPFSIEKKQRFKGFLFSTFPWIFRRCAAYHAWLSFSMLGKHSPTVNKSDLHPDITTSCVYVPLLDAAPVEKTPVNLICFYLPQFHTIPENNIWWGDGFTEWTNVQPAQAQFAGHYQPHVPGELGYYNLLDPAIQRRQVELAKLYGIGGFCFYFYWFGGKRLLEAPIENYLNDDSLDLPFCLCWANENWSRRWDGLDSEILMAQKHSAEDDLAFIHHVARYMRDDRYIRINGKPLLLVYRPSLLPSAEETTARWRDWCRANGIGEIYLAYTQSFENVDPSKYGFNAAIEFPPNNSSPPNITNTVTPTNENFASIVYDWRVFVERSEHYNKPTYNIFRSVCPSWDNTARRKNRGAVFLHSSPTLYQRWLENAIRDTEANRTDPEERLIFVNAWNEWAEGAHLEPDAHYGYAYLQATRNALSGERYVPDNRRKIVLVAHDAYPHGAQLLALNLARTLSQGMGFHVDLVCLGDGPLKAEFVKWATLHDLTGIDSRGPAAMALAKRLYESGHRAALVNTTVSGCFLETLTTHGVRCVALIHELRGVLDQNKLHGHAKAIAAHAKKLVFPAVEVADSFAEVSEMTPDKIVIRPQGLYKRRNKPADRNSVRQALRQKLGLPLDSQIILGVGYADHRKGIDLFVKAGLEMASQNPKALWVWAGHWEQSMQHAVEKQLAEHKALRDRFVFPGLQADTDIFYGGADVFALTSREDPFPSVVLEALEAEVPVVAFEGAGGFINLLKKGCGKLVPKESAEAFAHAVGGLLESPYEREAMGRIGAAIINERFSFRHYVFDLLEQLEIGIPRVSAIVPNYNYAKYLPERLGSIIKQDYPIYEIIFLDDCSLDDSVEVARQILESAGIDFKIVLNETNSGSVFRQWKKGVDLANGTHVWIAEADDSSAPEFVSEVLHGYVTPGVVLSYCESQQIDEEGQILATNYLDYVSDVDLRHWLTSYTNDGVEEIRNCLSIKNTIPNVSAVLFEKKALQTVLKERIEQICTNRIAGDWRVYVKLLAHGRIAFSTKPLNMHRRHSRGVTIGSFDQQLLDEIRGMQEFVADRHIVPEEKIQVAMEYIKSLSKQFNLTMH